MLVSIAVAVPVTTLVTHFGKVFWYAASGLIQSIFSNLPNISGNWIATFREPTENGNIAESREKIKLRQCGRLVWGTGSSLEENRGTFKYKAYLTRNTLVGTYLVKGSKRPSGSGTFQILVAGNDAIMNGQCMWHDYDTDKVETSAYRWTRESK